MESWGRWDSSRLWGKEELGERTNVGNRHKRGQLCVKRKEIMDHYRVLFFSSGLPGAWALSATQGEPTCIAHPSISVLQPRDFTPAGADTADTDCLQRLMSTLCETPQKSYPGETGSHRPKPCCDPRPQGQMFSSPPTFLTSPSRKEPRIKTTPVFSGLLV